MRRLPRYASDEWRQRLAQACAAHVGLGPATLVLYDVTTLYFEPDEGDGFREPGSSKERCLEPQITVGVDKGLFAADTVTPEFCRDVDMHDVYYYRPEHRRPLSEWCNSKRSLRCSLR